MKKLHAAAAAIAVAIALAATGCSSSTSSTSTDSSGTGAITKGGSLTWGWALPSTWDPVTSAVGNDVSALTLTYEGLTEEDAKGNAVPGLAKSWTYNKAGTAITFHLRSGLTFTDGTKLDATAVKESLTRGKTDKASTVAAQLTDIGSITADSATDVTLHLTQVDYQIPLLMSGKTGQIVSPTAAKNESSLATKPVGAGPFKLVSYTPGSQAVLVKNPSFWDAKKIYLKNFTLKNTPEAATASAGLQSGQFDVVDLQASQVSAIKSAGFPVEQTNVLPVRTIDINKTVAPYNNPKVVEALNYAINRPALIKASNFGFGTVQYQPFPTGYVAHNKSLDNLYPYNLSKAKSLLKSAGYSNGPKITLAMDVATDNSLGEQLQQQLNAAGFKTTLKMETPGTNNYITLNDPLLLDQFNARQSPVQALQVLFGAQGLLNLGKTTPPNLAAAVSKASSLPLTSPDYPAAIQAATKTAVTQMPNIFLYSVTRFEGHTTKVHGLQHWVDIQRFEGVWVSK